MSARPEETVPINLISVSDPGNPISLEGHSYATATQITQTHSQSAHYPGFVLLFPLLGQSHFRPFPLLSKTRLLVLMLLGHCCCDILVMRLLYLFIVVQFASALFSLLVFAFHFAHKIFICSSCRGLLAGPLFFSTPIPAPKMSPSKYLNRSCF